MCRTRSAASAWGIPAAVTYNGRAEAPRSTGTAWVAVRKADLATPITGTANSPPGNCRYRTVSTNPSSSAKQAQEALGARLREIRKDAGLSARALAAPTGQHFTRVSKLEHGVQAPSGQDIRDWCQACGAEEQIPDLIATARAVESAYLEFRRQARAGMKRVLGAHTVPLYEGTSLFRIYEHNVIPGLFQTAAYCAAMLSFWIDFLDVPNDLGAAVSARIERQRVLYQADKRFVVVLEEQALRTWFGPGPGCSRRTAQASFPAFCRPPRTRRRSCRSSARSTGLPMTLRMPSRPG